MSALGARIAIVGALGLLCMVHGPSEATVRHETIRVGVMPVRAVVRAPEDLFDDRPGVRTLQEQVGIWQRRIEAELVRLDQVRLLEPRRALESLRSRPAWRDKIDVARERFALGLEAYRHLELERALVNLDKARELYLSAAAGLLDGAGVADVALYRGLVFMEQGDAHRAHISFREMWAADPGRRFQRGYYTQATEEAMGTALLDLRDLTSSGRARPSAEDLGRLANELSLSSWVTARVEMSEVGEAVLRILIYDTVSGSLTVDERISLAQDQVAMGRLERILSAWHTCALTEERKPTGVTSAPLSRLSVSLAPSYSLFLKHDRTRALVHSPGGVVAVTWEPQGPLEIFGQATHMASLPDVNRDLVETFVTSRLMGGVGLRFARRTASISLRAGLEVAMTLSDIEMTNDVDCKHFGASHPRCGKLFTLPSAGAWLGLGFGAEGQVKLSRDWYLYASASLTSYVLTRELVADLNFPVTFGLGVGHRFPL